MKKEYGRSMIEMLGVLAIIGVLSIGGLAGYTMAMNRHRANTILDYISRCVVVAQTNGDGSTLETDNCATILDETAPSFLNGDVAVTLADGNADQINDIVVAGNAATEAIADAIRNRNTTAIQTSNSVGAAINVVFDKAGAGLQDAG